MSFDTKWFDELRKLDQVALGKVPDHEGFVPNVYELTTAGVLSYDFLKPTIQLVQALEKTKYKFAVHFRAYPHQITNFPRKRAFRKQWNIGFTAGEKPKDDYIRIGMGFRLGLPGESSGESGVEEYLEFKNKVKIRPHDFDSTLQIFDNYAQFGDLKVELPLSDMVINDAPNYNNDWRFFGKKLSFSSHQDRQIMSSLDKLVKAAVEVFDHINHSGFY